jgi:DNA-directed RNA polymerase specialized sigma24 family protein
MQPRTESTPAVRRDRSSPCGDEGELYRRHHRDLHRAVAHTVNAPRELIEDACQSAWAILLRAQPERTSIFGWLYVVATREALRLCERERRHNHLEAMFPAGTWDPVVVDAFSIDDILEVHEALEVIASLPARQRADLTLLVAGFSYLEIAGADRRAHVHQRQQAHRKGPRPRPPRATPRNHAAARAGRTAEGQQTEGANFG